MPEQRKYVLAALSGVAVATVLLALQPASASHLHVEATPLHAWTIEVSALSPEETPAEAGPAVESDVVGSTTPPTDTPPAETTPPSESAPPADTAPPAQTEPPVEPTPPVEEPPAPEPPADGAPSEPEPGTGSEATPAEPVDAPAP